VGSCSAGISREPVYLLPDWIDSTAVNAGATVGARNLPPHVRLVWGPRRQLLPTSRAIADLSCVLDEITDVMLCRAEERYVNFVHGRHSPLSDQAPESMGRFGVEADVAVV